MKPSVSVSGADAVKRTIEELAESLGGPNNVLIGVQKGAGEYNKSQVGVAVIAAVNHFGSADGHIPARPYLDVGILNNMDRYADIMENMLPDVMDGNISLDTMLNALGLAAASDVQEYMVELRDPPNSPFTIQKKKSDNPLIDTGFLRQSIRHEIAREQIEEGL